MTGRKVFTCFVSVILVAGSAFIFTNLNEIESSNRALSRELESMKAAKVSAGPQEVTYEPATT